MAAVPEKDAKEVLRLLYVDLHKVCATQDFDKALKASNKILQQFPNEFKAFHCKIVCLIQLDKFEDCLHQLRKNATAASSLFFEKAYCEYRLNRINEALQSLSNIEDDDFRCLELKAQILFRQEEYSQAHKIYKRIMKESDDDYSEERQTNYAALLAALRTYGGGDMESTGLPENTYELCYNAACFMVGKGDWVGAEEKLRAAEQLCMDSLAEDEDASKDEVDDELAPIRVQLAYVLQMQGRTDEAMKLYHLVVKHKSSDIAVMAVASNNIICLNKDQNVFDSKKRLKVATADNLKQKLNKAQRDSIALNQCLLYLYTNQGDMCKRSATSLESSQPNNSKPALIRAAQLMKEKKPNDALAYLKEFCARVNSTCADAAVDARLALVQIYLQTGSTGAACSELAQLPDWIRHRPGVVAAMVTLYKSQEDLEGACDALDDALEAKFQVDDPEVDLTAERQVLARRAAQLNLRAGNPQRAAELLEELRQSSPKDEKLLAQLVHAYSQFDTKKAEKVSRQLVSSKNPAEEENIDVDALETGFFGFGSRYKQRAAQREAGSPRSPALGGTPAAAAPAKHKKKKKPSKPPKNMDAPLDAERWMPRRERSYYRGKKKDKRREKDHLRGPQGATAAGTAAELDMGAKMEAKARAEAASAAAAAPGSPSSAPIGGGGEGPRQSKPSAAKQQKKKRKGGKW